MTWSLKPVKPQQVEIDHIVGATIASRIPFISKLASVGNQVRIDHQTAHKCLRVDLLIVTDSLQFLPMLSQPSPASAPSLVDPKLKPETLIAQLRYGVKPIWQLQEELITVQKKKAATDIAFRKSLVKGIKG